MFSNGGIGMRIEHLTKIYKTKGVNGVGLDDVSFTLPDTGLVFIVGKSGSGKSTLLNMLGGLDEITSGDIVIGEKRFSQFTNTDFDDYRNSYLGFVFQDFCLINELTVADNVRLALDFQGEKHDYMKVAEILEKVDLTEFANRKPTQLSGGQRQRVAIARALVKSPKLILADEPTGNLDSKTAVQVLDLLKKLSKDILVVVVSHNIADAEKYADRMIELADGKIVSDISRNECHENTFAVEDNVIYLPDKVRLTDEELETFNVAIAEGNKTIVQRETAFADTKEVCNVANEEMKFIPSKLSTKRTIEISGKFMGKKLLASILMTILITAVVVLFGLSNVFVQFDGAAAMNSAMQTSDDPAFVMNKGYINDDLIESLNTTHAIPIDDDDLDNFKSTGYKGKIYEKIFWSLPISESSYSCEAGVIENNAIYANFYATETRGILLCDEEYLTKVFGKVDEDGNRKLNVLAGSLIDEDHPEGIIVTDYVADCMIAYGVYAFAGSTYEQIANKAYGGRIYINAVIETDYKERFSSYLTALENREKVSKQAVAEFTEYAENYLSVTYTFNENFKQDFVDSKVSDLGRYRGATVELNGKEYSVGNSYYATFKTNNDKEKDECTMGVGMFNAIFGTSYRVDDVLEEPITLTFRMKSFSSNETTAAFTVRVTEFMVSDYGMFIYDPEITKAMQTSNFRTVSLYFDNFDNIAEIYSTGVENNFYSATAYFKTVQSITKIVSVFKDIFVLIAIGLCGVMVLLMAFFAFSNIRSRNYEIGVMKAIGARTRNVAGIFLVQVICVGLAICILFGLFFYFGMPLANNLLMDSLIEYVENASIGGITLLAFDSQVMWISITIVLGVTTVSAFLPFLGVMTIKPVNIIKSKS